MTAPIVKEPRYHPRASFHGTLDWLCACCGMPQVSLLRPNVSLVRCDRRGDYVLDDGSTRKCLTTWELGLRFAQVPVLPRGRAGLTAPPDWGVPHGLADAFPRGDLFRWQAGWPAHVLAGGNVLERALADDSDSLSPLVEFVRRVQERAAVIEQRYSPAVSTGKAFAEQVTQLVGSGLVSAAEFGKLAKVRL